MVDCLVSMAAEATSTWRTSRRRPRRPCRAKGVGESGTGAVPAVVMNAINDALLPFKVRVTMQPITPEMILTALAKI